MDGHPTDPSADQASPPPANKRSSISNSVDGNCHRQSSQRRRSSQSSMKNAWKLKYQDFLPINKKEEFTAGRSEQFQKLVDRANDWLKKNPDVAVKTCETLTWMSSNSKRLGDSEQMVLSKRLTDGATTYYSRGIRLWLVPQHIPKAQTLSFEDSLPDENDHIEELVDKVNRKIQQKHLQGKILTVETVGVPVVKGRIRNNVTCWSETVDTDSPYAFVLRVFVARETKRPSPKNSHVTIGIKDMVPLATEDGYEGFEVLTERTNAWLKDQRDSVLITNMQSVMVLKREGLHLEIGRFCRYNMPGINNSEPVEFFRILRVYFIKLDSPICDGDVAAETTPPAEGLDHPDAATAPLAAAAAAGDQTVCYPFIYETFTPELVREKDGDGCGQALQQPVLVERLEKMKETFAKVIAFLRNSGADVICAETVMNPMQLYCDDAGQPHDDEMKFLFTVRLYLMGQIGQLVNGSTRLIKRVTSSNNLDDSLLPLQGKHHRSSPLFLRSVVTRQFKYRWLVLAVSAFTCMAIIVAVSVIYSNRFW